MVTCVRQVGFLSAVGVCCLRDLFPSKTLLLYGEIRDDNVANNGGTFISFLAYGKIFSLGRLGMLYLLEDQKIFKAIPWEVVLKSSSHILLVS